MSTLVLSHSALDKIANAAYWLARNSHQSNAWLDRQFLVNRGLSWTFTAHNEYSTDLEKIERLVDTLSLFNQRAYVKRYSAPMQAERYRMRNFGMFRVTRDAFVDALKQLECLEYNLDDYAYNETINAAYTGLRELFICQIIHQSEAYNSAPWGS